VAPPPEVEQAVTATARQHADAIVLTDFMTELQGV
jgi:hypothetical protein